jgi:hypothetical protein
MRRLLWQLTSTAPTRSRQTVGRVLVVLLSICASFVVHGASFTASLDRDAVPVGESAVLTLKFEGGDPGAFPALPSIPNLQVVNGGSSRNVTFINGAVSSSISQTFELIPTQPGEYVIPALRAEVDGKVLMSQALKLTAVKGEAAAAAKNNEQLAFFKVFAPKKEVFLGEILAVELQVYVREGVANAEQILRYFERYTGSPLKAEGFSVLKTVPAQRRQARAGNILYHVATLVTSLAPVKTGDLTIGSMEATIPVQVPLPNQRRRDSFFDPFGMFGPQVEERHVALSASPETLKVLPLPKDNVPAQFNGAVGKYTLSVSAGPTNVAMGDPITVKIQISGRGALDALTLPQQNDWRDFKTYPPTTKVDTTDSLGLEGTKTFEQVVVPQSAEIKQLPTLSFSFFDPDQKSYRTLTHPPVQLIVRPSVSATAPLLAGGRAAQDNPPPAQDIVHIKPRMGSVAQIAPPLLQQPWFIVLQGVPIVAWVSAVWLRQRKEKLANNPRLRRRRQVAQLIRDGLPRLRQLAAENKSDEFFAEMIRLLQEQLGERLDLPASAITEAVIDERLRSQSLSEAALSELRELFQTSNLVRYAPIKTSQELAALIPKLEKVLHELQELRV